MKTSDGTSKNSKFRVARYEKEKGNRSEANKVEAKGGKMGAVMDGMESETEQKPQAKQAGPNQGMAPSKPNDIHITHDDATGMHHVTVVHPDGTEEHSDHASRADAHFHGAQAAGAADEQENPELKNDKFQTQENDHDE